MSSFWQIAANRGLEESHWAEPHNGRLFLAQNDAHDLQDLMACSRRLPQFTPQCHAELRLRLTWTVFRVNQFVEVRTTRPTPY